MSSGTSEIKYCYTLCLQVGGVSNHVIMIKTYLFSLQYLNQFCLAIYCVI